LNSNRYGSGAVWRRSCDQHVEISRLSALRVKANDASARSLGRTATGLADVRFRSLRPRRRLVSFRSSGTPALSHFRVA
jgi:hypothetical protein